jgi:anti-sigma B factor antagonist
LFITWLRRAAQGVVAVRNDYVKISLTFKEDSSVPNPFAVQTSLRDDISVIALEGFVDAHTAPDFEQAIQAEIDAGRVRLIVDCAKLNYISSAGLGVFMSFVEEVRERGGDIKICGLAPKVKSTFEILGFNDLYDLVEDVPTAARRFAEAPPREG